MKAQFKYAFKTGLYARSGVFAVIFVMNLVFIILGLFDLLPYAAHITAVSLGGVAIAVMMAFDIVGDVAVIRRMFSAPDAYLHLLTPVPRRKILLASVIAMAIMDFITMAVVIIGETLLSFNLAGVEKIWNIVISTLRENPSDLLYILYGTLLLIAGYLLVMMIILFCVTAQKSIFFRMPASGLLVFLLGCACVYIVSLIQLILAPFGSVNRYAIFIMVTINGAALPAYILLLLVEAAALFVITAKLMERKMNI